jgi:hypothetical protein
MQAITDEAEALKRRDAVDEQQEPTADLLSSKDEDVIF